MKETQVSGVQFLKPGKYPAIVLYLVDEAFHQVTLPVQVSIVGLGFFPVGARRYDRTHAPFQDMLTKLLGIIPLVGNHVLSGIIGDQTLSLGDVMLLSTSQDEPQGITQCIHAHVDLGAKPATVPTQGLGCLSTFLGGAPAAQGWARTTVLSMMRHSISGSSAEMLMHQFPDAPVGPAGEPFVHTVPVSILGREEPPLGAGTVHPQHRLDETLAFRFLTNVQVGATTQELENPGPLVW